MIKYRAEIDGLRAIAVIPVIFFHAGFELFRGGFVGVDIFFVISGYLITSIILSELNEKSFSIFRFYERRARRILPALFFVFFACVPFALIWLTSDELLNFSNSLLSAVFFSSNIFFSFDSGYFSSPAELKPLLHTWSLAVEEQFYIIWPFFLLLFSKLKWKWILYFLIIIFFISLGLAHWGALNYPNYNFYLLPTRGWELLLGVFAAFYLNDRENPYSESFNQFMSIVGLCMIIFAIIFFDETTLFPSFYTLIPTIGTLILIFSVVQGTYLYRILSFTPIVTLGLISYSTYLWHQPILAFARHRFIDEVSDILLLSLCFSSFFLAYITWIFIEKPFRDKRRISSKLFLKFIVFSTIFFLTFVFFINHNNGLNERFSDDVKALQAIKINSMSFSTECEKKLSNGSEDEIFQSCLIGAKSSKPTFSIIGDSHAGSLIAGFDLQGKNSGISGYNFSHTNCFPSLGAGAYIPFDRFQKECIEIREKIKNYIERGLLPKKIFLLARWTITFETSRFNNEEGGVETGKPFVYKNDLMSYISFKEAIKQELSETIKFYKQQGFEVTIIYPIPEVGWDPLKIAIKEKIVNDKVDFNNSFRSTSYEVFKRRNLKTIHILDELVREHSINKFSTDSLFCNLNLLPERCIVFQNSLPLYYDDDHLSEHGGLKVAKKILR